MSELSARLFGRLSVQRGGRDVDGIDSAKAQELLCYLLIWPGRSHAREVLAAMLWADHPTPQSRKYLRQVLWQLQGALAETAERDPLLVIEPDWVGLNAAAAIDCDVAAFERAYAAVRGRPGHEFDEEQARLVEASVALYRGDLLEGWYQDWCVYERERLQSAYLFMLDKLMAYHEARREYEAGIEYGARILRYDRAQERAHQRLIRLHYLAGDRAAALRQYRRCEAALREELGVAPSSRTTALYEEVCADSGLPPAERAGTEQAARAAAAAPAAGPPSLSDLLRQLRLLQTVLASTQRTLGDGIRVAELTRVEPRQPDRPR